MGGHAAGFLDLLAGGGPVTFQTFDDRGRDPRLACVLHGTLAQHSRRLASLNRRGAGVFVTVNATDLRGRSAENVTALRVLFTDDDGAGRRTTALLPSFVVHTGRGLHSYWLLHPGEPLERFGPAQKQLARALNTDPKVSDLPRVMRMPGFYHRKDGPHPVELEAIHPCRRYTIDEVLAAYPAPVAPRKPLRRQIRHRESRAEYRGWSRPIPEGKRNDTLFRLACALLRRGVPGSQILSAIEDANGWCDRPLDEREIDQIVANAWRYYG